MPRIAKKAPASAGPEKINRALLPLTVPIDSLDYDQENVRKHDQRSIDAIAASLTEFGQQKPIVVDPTGKVAKAGNGTLAAAIKLGWTRIAAVAFDGDPSKLRAYAVADNRTSDLSHFDEELLAEALDQIRMEWDAFKPEAIGFTEEEVARLSSAIASQNGSDENPDPDRVVGVMPGQTSNRTLHVTLTEDQHQTILSQLERLARHHGTSSVSDTIIAVVAKAAQALSPPSSAA